MLLRNSLELQQMRDATSCFPTPPCLDLRGFRPYRPHPAVLLHEGWTAAQKGEPLDESQPSGWREGWMLWHQHHPTTTDTVLDACVRELRGMLAEARLQEAILPPVQPLI